MNPTKLLVPASILVFCAMAPASRAAVLSYDASLSGSGESTSTGTGAAVVDYDNVAHTLHVHVTFSGLTGDTTASHIHAPTVTPGTGTAGVATTLPTFAGFPLGVTSGTYDNTLDLTQSTSYNPAFITANGGTTATAELALTTDIADGKAYLNIHTTAFPGGEIRGFLVPVPEPASLGVLACAGASLLLRRRRRA